MKIEEVEIYSDKTNLAVMKHPRRNYPGSLIQGDSLYILCTDLDEAIEDLKQKNYDDAYYCLNEIRNGLWERLNNYIEVLTEHGMDVPFSKK